MTAQTLPNLGFSAGYLDTELGWGAATNKNFRIADALIQARVVDKDLLAPPGSPVAGSLYIVAGPTPTGAWAGQAGKLALWQVGDDLVSAWLFITPKEGFRVYVDDENTRYEYNGTAWGAVAGDGVSKYAANIGDASAATFAVVHNLGTRDVHVTVYRNATPWDTVIVDVARPDANTVQISGFAVAPALNQYRVVVSK